MDTYIHDGPPPISHVTPTDTDTPGLEVRALCLVDGLAAEVQHHINIKRQEYNSHSLLIFDPHKLIWRRLLDWGIADAGHVPTYPETDAVERLRVISEQMWRIGSEIVVRSRMRREDLDVEQGIALELARQRVKKAIFDAAVETGEVDSPTVDRGEINFGPTPGIDPGQVLADRIVAYAEEREAEDRLSEETEGAGDENR